MKKIKKAAALIISMAIAAGMMQAVPVSAFENVTEYAEVFAADFDETDASFVSFQSNGAMPAASVEGTTDKYMFVDDTNGWSYGGFVFGSTISDGEFELSFDYSVTKWGYQNYGSVFLTDDNIIGNNNQPAEFRLLDWKNNQLYAGNAALSGNLEYALNHWYTYKMKIDRTAMTYTVTITDKEDATKSATVSGSNFPNKDINRLMFGTGVIMSVDNISLKKKVFVDGVLFAADFDDNTAPFVSFNNGVMPAASLEGTTDKYMRIDDSNGGWRFGGFVFGGAMTDGEYELSFDFSTEIGSSYGDIFLTDESHGGNSQYQEFRLIRWVNNAFQTGNLDLSGNLVHSLNHWYNYKMTLNRTAGTYTVTITDREDPSKHSSLTASNLPNKDFDRIMFGCSTITLIDNILVKKIYKAPEVLSVEYLDRNDGVQPELNTETKKIRFTFSDTMDSSTLSGAASVSTGGNTLSVSGALSEDKLSYVLTLNEDIVNGTVYTIGVSSSAISEHGIGIENDYYVNAKASNGSILLNIDYDNINPDVEYWDSGTSSVTYPTDDGNMYANVEVSYRNIGYSLKNTIYADDGDYNISFDFKDYTYQAGYIMALTQKNCLAGSGDLSTYDQFGLLRLDGDKFLVAGLTVPGMTYEAGKWYHYKMNFNRSTRAFDITITDKANPENKAHLVSTLPNASWGAGMYEWRSYDALKFYNSGSVSVDNILIKAGKDYEKSEAVFEVSNVITDDNGTYKKAFNINNIDEWSKYNSMLVKCGDNAPRGCTLEAIGLSGLSGNGSIGFIITNLPSRDTTKVRFTEEEVK